MAGPVTCNGREAELTENPIGWRSPRRLGASAKRIVSLASLAKRLPPRVFRASVQRKAVPNLFQTLIDATADVR